MRITEDLCERIARSVTFESYRHQPGAELDDVLQAARIGVWKATRDYKPERGGFVGFAQLCARRQVITELKAATRQKHRVLNEAASWDAPLPTRPDEEVVLGDLIYRPYDDPCLIVIAREAAQRLLARFERLSALEREAVERVCFAGESYEAAGDQLDVPVKSIDNAIQRARRKIGQALAADDDLPLAA